MSNRDEHPRTLVNHRMHVWFYSSIFGCNKLHRPTNLSQNCSQDKYLFHLFHLNHFFTFNALTVKCRTASNHIWVNWVIKFFFLLFLLCLVGSCSQQLCGHLTPRWCCFRPLSVSVTRHQRQVVLKSTVEKAECFFPLERENKVEN